MWYASKQNQLISNNNTISRKKKLKILHKHQISRKIKHFKNKNQVVTIWVPSNWSVLVTSSIRYETTLILIITPFYFIKIPAFFSKQFLKFSHVTNQILINHFLIDNFTQLYLNFIKLIIVSLYKPFFTKIKFKGKGYYIYKSYRNTVTPQFGYSHRLYLYTYFTRVKFLTKTSLIIFGVNKNDINITSHKLFDWRPLNIFTGRGVRFAKQTIYKKAGKISSYR